MNGREHGHRQPRGRLPDADRAGRPRRPLRARQARARPAGGEGVPARPGHATTSRRWTPGHGCYAAFLTHKGKMLGDLRVLDVGDELWLDTERVALQELFNMIRRYKLGRDVELHKRTLERALLSLVGPRRARSPARGPAAPSTTTRREIGGVPASLVATDVGVDVDLRRRAHRRRSRAALGRGASRARGGGRDRARRARAAALRHRPRRRRDPPGGRPQRARGRRSPRAATSARRRSRGSTTAASRTATCAGCGCPRPVATRRRRCGSASARSAASARRSSPPRSGPIALALVRREAAPGDDGRRGRGATADGRRAAVHLAASTPRARRRRRPSGPARRPPHALRLDEHEAGHRLAAGAAELVHVRLAARGLRLLRFDAHHELRLAHHADRHVAADHPSHPAEHLSFNHIRARCHQLSDRVRQTLVVRHAEL